MVRVRVAATDLELTIETSFKAGVDEPGKRDRSRPACSARWRAASVPAR